MFEEIDKEKKELSEYKYVVDRLISKRDYNVYQIIAIIILIVGLIGGIFIGNMFASCVEANLIGQCTHTEFNLALTIICWLGCALLSLFIYAIGHIIAILESINKKLK